MTEYEELILETHVYNTYVCVQLKLCNHKNVQIYPSVDYSDERLASSESPLKCAFINKRILLKSNQVLHAYQSLFRLVSAGTLCLRLNFFVDSSSIVITGYR